MCFSASASFIAGGVLSASGVTILKSKKKKKEIPLALIPLLFGIQQLTEGLVWLSLQNSMPNLNAIVTAVYVFFSHGLWPIFVPIAIYLIEPSAWRKKIILFFGLLGTAASLYVLSFTIFFPVTSQIANHSIQYIFPVMALPDFIYIPIYLAATCLTCFLSSHRLINFLGICTTISLAISYYYYLGTLASVWCFFSAILSLIIIFFFYKRSKF